MRLNFLALCAVACMALLPAAAQASLISNPVITAFGGASVNGGPSAGFTWPQTSASAFSTHASVSETDSPTFLTANASSTDGDTGGSASATLRITFDLANDTPYDLHVVAFINGGLASGLLDGTIGIAAPAHLFDDTSYDFQGILPAGTHFIEVHTTASGALGSTPHASVTFSVVPEPASLSLLALGTLLTLRRPTSRRIHLNPR